MARIKTIDLNRIDAEELVEADIEGIDEARAMALVEYREENGPFESWEDVKDVSGFNDRLIEKLQENGAILGAMETEEDIE